MNYYEQADFKRLVKEALREFFKMEKNVIIIRPKWDELLKQITPGIVLCSCREQISDLNTLSKHYMLGHFDKEV